MEEQKAQEMVEAFKPLAGLNCEKELRQIIERAWQESHPNSKVYKILQEAQFLGLAGMEQKESETEG